MGDTILIETTADEVVSIVTQGPQGPSGAEAATLTTLGDTLYRGATAPQRLPIGSEGQVLKVANGIPAWGNESGAVTSVNGETGTVVLDAADVGAVADSDPRLTDTRDPNAHAASHAAAGSDPVFDQDLNTDDDATFNKVFTTEIEATGGGAKIDFVNGIFIDQNAVTTIDWQTSEDNVNLYKGIDILGIDAELFKTNTRANLGLGDSAEADIGTGAGDVCAGDDARLHDRSHAITSTSDHTAGNHKIFYSNGSGEIVELALGAASTVLTSAGTAAAPSFEAAASGGGEVRSDFVSPYTYTGLAPAGTSESAASWTIRRSEFDAAGAFVATLEASTVEWDDRLTASYS